MQGTEVGVGAINWDAEFGDESRLLCIRQQNRMGKWLAEDADATVAGLLVLLALSEKFNHADERIAAASQFIAQRGELRMKRGFPA